MGREGATRDSSAVHSGLDPRLFASIISIGGVLLPWPHWGAALLARKAIPLSPYVHTL